LSDFTVMHILGTTTNNGNNCNKQVLYVQRSRLIFF
jgi:hypothetical protein